MVIIRLSLIHIYFGLEVKAGHLKIVKTSEDGKVSGLPFHVSGSGVEKDVSTGSDGTCLLYTSRGPALDRIRPGKESVPGIPVPFFPAGKLQV